MYNDISSVKNIVECYTSKWSKITGKQYDFMIYDVGCIYVWPLMLYVNNISFPIDTDNIITAIKICNQ